MLHIEPTMLRFTMLTLLGLATVQALAIQPATECSTYKMLESFLLNNDENVVNISRGFFPPYLTSTSMGNRAYGKSPVFATIIYQFVDDLQPNTSSGSSMDTQHSDEAVWFWGESEFYLLQPITIFQFTSLFFGKTGYHTTLIYLTLPDICKYVSNDHMELLTHRLKAYAATHGNIATISADVYSGVAANNETLMLQLQQYYDRGDNIPVMITTIQVVFPVYTIILVLWSGLFAYVMFFRNKDTTPKIKWRKHSLLLSISMTAFYVVVVILIADSLAIGFLFQKLFETEQIHNQDMDHYWLPLVTIGLDSISFLYACIAIVIYVAFTSAIWFLVINLVLCALFSFSNHIFYVMIAFLNDTQYASNITVYYFIVLVIYWVTFYLVNGCMLSPQHLQDPKNVKDTRRTRFRNILVCIMVGVFMFGYQVMLTTYFVLIPIRESISKTPNSIFVVYQIPIMLIGALVVYKTVTKTSPEHFFDKLTKEYDRHSNRDKNMEQSKTENVVDKNMEQLKTGNFAAFLIKVLQIQAEDADARKRDRDRVNNKLTQENGEESDENRVSNTD